jgi:hypothetical protein
VSDLAVTEANVRKTLKTPFKNMTPFTELPEEQIVALIALLKTL